MKIPYLAPIGNITPENFIHDGRAFVWWPKHKILSFRRTPKGTSVGTYVGLRLIKGGLLRRNKVEVFLFANDMLGESQSSGVYSDTSQIENALLRNGVEFGLGTWAAELAKRDRAAKESLAQSLKHL